MKTTTPAVKYLGKHDKRVITYTLAYDDYLDGWVIYNGMFNGHPNYVSTGSQARGTHGIKTWKTAANARKWFDKTQARDNDSTYTPLYYALDTK